MEPHTSETTALSPEQRREEIMKRVFTTGHVTVSGLVPLLSVSEATLRRDLRALAEVHRLELVHGGAIMRAGVDFSIQSRAQRNVEVKRIIGRMAADLISDSELLFIDPGTTCFEMCRYLERKRGMSIIVSSVRLTAELSRHPDCHIIQLGGHYRRNFMDCAGTLTIAMVDQMRGYRAFIGTDGLDREFGVTSSDLETCGLFQHLLKNAREVNLLADHSKFVAPSLFRISGWEAISRVVTDREPDPEWREFLDSRGISVVRPPSNPLMADND